MRYAHVALPLVDSLLVLLKVDLLLFLYRLERSAVLDSEHIEVLVLSCILFHPLNFFQTGVLILLGAEENPLLLLLGVILDGLSLVR